MGYKPSFPHAFFRRQSAIPSATPKTSSAPSIPARMVAKALLSNAGEYIIGDNLIEGGTRRLQEALLLGNPFQAVGMG